MSDTLKISCIIVNWKVADSLQRCLLSLKKTNYPDLETIIIDNASSDESLEVVQKNKKSFATLNIKLIINSKNLGFPRAVNQGLRQAMGDHLLLLNPDCRVGKDFFTQSLKFFSLHPTAAVMGPTLTDPDGTPQGSVFPEPSVANTFKEFWLGKKGLTSKYLPDENKPTIVNAISGACMFFPRSTLEKIGLFTEKVFMYYEDLDYCRRIRREGLRVYFNPQITVIHEHGSSSVQNPNARKYLWDASLWYNGALKHHLMWFISWTGQKLHSDNT